MGVSPATPGVQGGPQGTPVVLLLVLHLSLVHTCTPCPSLWKVDR